MTTTLELLPNSLLPLSSSSICLFNILFSYKAATKAAVFCCCCIILAFRALLKVVGLLSNVADGTTKRSLDQTCLKLGLTPDCLPALLLDFCREDCRMEPCKLFAILRVPLSIWVQQASSLSKTEDCLQKGSIVCLLTPDCYINNLKQNIYSHCHNNLVLSTVKFNPFPQGEYVQGGEYIRVFDL